MKFFAGALLMLIGDLMCLGSIPGLSGQLPPMYGWPLLMTGALMFFLGWWLVTKSSE
jgi:hypothetical protein